MKKRILILVFGLLLLKSTNGYATTHPIKPDYQKNRSEFENIQKSIPGSILLKGEIIGINHMEILVTPLTANTDIYRLKLVKNTKFYCNGTDSGWEALMPVAPEAYFEAQVIVNGQTEAIAVNAFYYGEECIIKKCYLNYGRLTFELISVLSEEVFISPVAKDARLPSGESWMKEGQVVYILLNEEEEIRAGFLPD